jgi:hypothetical protein
LWVDPRLPRDTITLPAWERLQSVAQQAGAALDLSITPGTKATAEISIRREESESGEKGGYTLEITQRGVVLGVSGNAGVHAGISTLRQLIREHGRRLPCLKIKDHPDFARRGFMLDVSRGRVPRIETLLGLTEHLADFKINELQLYTEHTFAYHDYEPVWRGWSPLTGGEILRLDAHCRKLGIELVPNQNSFGHLRHWLEHPALKHLAETSQPWPDQDGAFLRHPSTLAPNNPGTLPFLRGLYDELLPHFSSNRFNVGCDETWDLGRGQSAGICRKKGKARVYADFLKKIHRELQSRKKKMMFWGDIIIKSPDLINELPKDMVALNWGYEAGHPFNHEASAFAKAGIPFYVCPGTSTWMTLIGRHDNALANLAEAAKAGLAHGAEGFLITDWGDGGHLNPLGASYIPLLAGASLAWCGQSFEKSKIAHVLDRDVFQDEVGVTGITAMALGLAHRKLHYTAPNLTPLGSVIAAPPPEMKELFCRDGLKYFARIPGERVRSALEEVEGLRQDLGRARPGTDAAKNILAELDFAAAMAAQSCEFMLWQQDIAGGRNKSARIRAGQGMKVLKEIQDELHRQWPLRNKGIPAAHWPFLKWRMADYRGGILPVPVEISLSEQINAGAN